MSRFLRALPPILLLLSLRARREGLRMVDVKAQGTGWWYPDCHEFCREAA